MRFDDERLLDQRLCDLDLKIEGTDLEPRVARLHEELERRGIRHRPHVWLSTEWFSPDGIPGVAIPFFLAHPRLMKLEARQMLEVEGGSETECMRLLRHEAGHAIDSAYRLHFRKPWRETFGRYSEPYPDVYRPRPNSRNYVVHLRAWYAQAHPAEDWAETFAVWLAPGSDWRRRYRGWDGALRKLRFVDGLMKDVAGRPARVRSRRRIEPVGELSMTLRRYYARKRARYAVDWPDFFDRDLRRLFSDEPRYRSRPSAAGFLRAQRTHLLADVAEWTGAHAYTIDQVLKDIVERSRELKLRLAVSERAARRGALMLLTVHTMTFLHTTKREIPL